MVKPSFKGQCHLKEEMMFQWVDAMAKKGLFCILLNEASWPIRPANMPLLLDLMGQVDVTGQVVSQIQRL